MYFVPAYDVCSKCFSFVQTFGDRSAKTHVTVMKVVPVHAVKAYRGGGTPAPVLNIGIRRI